MNEYTTYLKHRIFKISGVDILNRGNYRVGVFVFLVVGLFLSVFVIAEDIKNSDNGSSVKPDENLSGFNSSEVYFDGLQSSNVSEENVSVDSIPESEEDLKKIVIEAIENEVKEQNYCELDSDCVWAIRDDDCCSCPHIGTKTNLQKDNHLLTFGGYKKRSEGETYPALSKMDCSNTMCRESCLPTSQLKCIDNKCQRGYIIEIYKKE